MDNGAGSTKTNYCGCAVLDAFVTLELEIANMDILQTYAKAGKSSVIDLIILYPRLMATRFGWKVTDLYTGSTYFTLVYYNPACCKKDEEHHDYEIGTIYLRPRHVPNSSGGSSSKRHARCNINL